MVGTRGRGWRRHTLKGLLFQTVKALKKILFRNGTVHGLRTANDTLMDAMSATKYPLTSPQGGEKSC
jgi:hypothetical protein